MDVQGVDHLELFKMLFGKEEILIDIGAGDQQALIRTNITELRSKAEVIMSDTEKIEEMRFKNAQ